MKYILVLFTMLFCINAYAHPHVVRLQTWFGGELDQNEVILFAENNVCQEDINNVIVVDEHSKKNKRCWLGDCQITVSESSGLPVLVYQMCEVFCNFKHRCWETNYQITCEDDYCYYTSNLYCNFDPKSLIK